MPNRCVAGGCSNVPDPSRNIGLHKFPDENEKQRRKVWVNFVLTKLAKWTPTSTSRLCSSHFLENCFESPFISIPGTTFKSRAVLKKDAVPSIHAVVSASGKTNGCTDGSERGKRKRRRVVRDILKEETVTSFDLPKTDKLASEDVLVDCSASLEDTVLPTNKEDPTFIEEEAKDQSCQTPECLGCRSLTSQLRQMKNKVIDLKQKIKDQCELINKQKATLTSQNEQISKFENEEKIVSIEVAEVQSSDDEMQYLEEEPSSPGYHTGTDYEPETETESEDETELDDEKPHDINSKNQPSSNLRTEPKFVVFLTQLLELFHFCPSCKCDQPLIKTSVLGTMIEVTIQCVNPQCTQPTNTWRSQPTMTGTKMPAGNFLLCFSILVSGASPSKVLQVFSHMGLACISLRTYFRHQAAKLFPTIHTFWKAYQGEMFEKLNEIKQTTGESVVIAGDGRHDSMGHSAKYCAYTLFCCTVPLIIDFSLIQRNVAGSSPAMEKLGFIKCLDTLATCGVDFSTLITDRHTGIAKYMREDMANIKHYFDLWHLKKKVHKVLSKISKEKECESLAEWIEPCENHLMWSATSTPSGDGELIWAKFESFLSHVVNKHSALANPLFDKCSHAETIPDRRWLEEDTKVYEKVCTDLKKTSLVKGIKKASPVAQTSCLEGFHSVVNQYSPKMTAYSYQGMYCRHIIAATHFNYNLHRDVKLHEDGTQQVNIIYPKFKNGKATVKNVHVKPNYDYIEKMYNTYLDAAESKTLATALDELDQMTPEPMNTMLDKQPRADALDLWRRRKSMVVEEVPSTMTENEVVPNNQSTAVQPSQRRVRRCTDCKKPMKGHKNVKDCKRNQ